MFPDLINGINAFIHDTLHILKVGWILIFRHGWDWKNYDLKSSMSKTRFFIRSQEISHRFGQNFFDQDETVWDKQTVIIHFSNDLFLRCLILTSFNTKKYCFKNHLLLRNYEIWRILTGYCLKSKNSLKRNYNEKYHSSSFKPNFKKLQSLNFKCFWDSHLSCIRRSEILNHSFLFKCQFSLAQHAHL